MPLDAVRQFEDDTFDRATDQDTQRDLRSPVEMTRLRKAMSFADAKRHDMILFRRTWDGAVSFKSTEGESDIKPIERAAVYPKSHIMHFSILASLVLFEGLANAYFFSQGSDLGLLGG